MTGFIIMRTRVAPSTFTASYWTIGGFHADIHKATRFAREDDAHPFIDKMLSDPFDSRDHKFEIVAYPWCDLPLARPAPAKSWVVCWMKADGKYFLDRDAWTINIDAAQRFETYDDCKVVWWNWANHKDIIIVGCHLPPNEAGQLHPPVTPNKAYARCMGPWPKCGHPDDTCTACPGYQAGIRAAQDELTAKPPAQRTVAEKLQRIREILDDAP